MKLTLILALTATAAFAQGPLTPPGAPAPTGKSLTEIYDKAEAADAKAEKRIPISSLPFHIDQRGSYYLTSNLTISTSGITVATSQVTIDLNGFTISGGNTPGPAISGEFRDRVVVKNGSIVGTTETAVTLGRYALIESLQADKQISVSVASLVRNVRIRVSDSALFPTAILLGDACTVEDSTVDFPMVGAATGISAGKLAKVRNCTVYGSDTELQTGIQIASGSVSDCITDSCIIGVVSNTTPRGTLRISGFTATNCKFGISSGDGSVIERCTLAGVDNPTATHSGLATGANSVVRDVTVSRFAFGIVAGARSRISDCVSHFADIQGISAGESSNVTGCTVVASSGGIAASSGSTIADCIVRENGQGIITFGNARISRCTVEQNFTGMQVYLGGCRIEDNQLLNNTTGMVMETTGNTVFKNTFQGNGFNITCPPGNDIAPAGSAATATSPFANIAF